MVPVIAAVAILTLVGRAYLTNLFSRITIVRQMFIVQTLISSFQAINHNHKLRIQQASWWRLYVETVGSRLDKYEEVMVRDGKLYESSLYLSIRQTGWVIDFEQARTIYAAIKG